MNPKPLLLLLLLLPATVCVAQKKPVAQKKQKMPREILTQGTKFIRFNFMGLVNVIDPNLSGGFEYRFHDKFSVSADVGWIFYSQYFAANNSSQGFLVRPAARWYAGKKENLFIEAEFHYKQVNHKVRDWLGKNCVNGVPAYEELKDFTFRRQHLGVHGKIGTQEKITQNGRIWFEVYVGLGVRRVWEKVAGEENCCYNPPQNQFDFGPRTDLDNNQEPKYIGVLPAGFRLLYKL